MGNTYITWLSVLAPRNPVLNEKLCQPFSPALVSDQYRYGWKSENGPTLLGGVETALVGYVKPSEAGSAYSLPSALSVQPMPKRSSCVPRVEHVGSCGGVVGRVQS